MLFFTQRHFSTLSFLKILVHLSTMKKQHRNYIPEKAFLPHKKHWLRCEYIILKLQSNDCRLWLKGFYFFLCGLWLKMCIEEMLVIAAKVEDSQFKHDYSAIFSPFFAACHCSPTILSLLSVAFLPHHLKLSTSSPNLS